MSNQTTNDERQTTNVKVTKQRRLIYFNGTLRVSEPRKYLHFHQMFTFNNFSFSLTHSSIKTNIDKGMV